MENKNKQKKEYKVVWTCDYCGRDFDNKEDADKHEKSCQGINKETFNPKIHVAEVKRTCNQCGKVWHTLASREMELVNNIGLESLGMCGTCGSPAQAQHGHNLDSNQNELLTTKQCPNCKSSDYKEEVIYYKKNRQNNE
jgi:hypothetical protein